MSPALVTGAPAATWRLVPFLPAHYDVLIGALEPERVRPNPEAGQVYAHGGPAVTALVDDVPAAAAGLLIPWPGRAIAWALVGPAARRRPHQVTRAIAAGLGRLIVEHRLRRVEADVLASWGPGQRWIEMLGFEPESTMPAYGPRGETFVRYVLFPGVMR